MHYTGMAAMQMPGSVRYDAPMFALSILVAVVFSILSLWIRFGIIHFDALKQLNSNYLNLVSGAVMGSAISGMHYTGMAATRFVRPESMFVAMSGQEGNAEPLALLVVIITGVIISFGLVVSLGIRYKDISLTAQANESRLRAIMETAVDGIVTIDIRGTIVSVNHAVEQILGWGSQDMVGSNVKMLMPEPHRSQHDD
jgi:hypothetical protein